MHILIADNSRSILDIVSKQVVSRGNTVTTFQDGQDVYDYVTAGHPFEILLTSLELPNVSGLELCWAANACAENGTSNYSIVMSSSSDVETLVEALDSGADDFLAKPFLQQELNARIRAAERTVSAQNELLRLARKDDLTNISNRRDFFQRIDNKMMSFTAKKASSMITFDVDHLRQINEKYGYEAGDAMLVALAGAIENEAIIFGRLGSQEFGVFLHEVPIEKAETIAESIRKKIARLTVTHNENSLNVSVTLGACSVPANDSKETALKKARQALDAAKNLGRNRTVVWGSVDHQSSIEETPSVQGYDHINGKSQVTSHALKLATM
ncbi:MAG: diguanylate cyclase [Hyphomicrobiales bacterium]